MPRTADQHLQQRILEAAHRLWRARGEKGFTLRAVARQAGTTTTTVYKRFRNKEALRLAIAGRVQELLAAQIISATSLEQAYRRYLQFAENHPREYQLLLGTAWTEVFGPGRSRPAQTWLLSQMAARFGGEPKDYIQAHYALFLVVHGAASLLTATPKRRANIEARESCIAVCDSLVNSIHVFRKKTVP